MLWALLVALLCVTGGAAVWSGTVYYHDEGQPHTTQTASKPNPPAPKAPAPPLGAGVHAFPPPPPDADKQFVALVDTIEGGEVTNPDLLVSAARNVCQLLRTGTATPEQVIDAAVTNQGDTRAVAAQLLRDGEIIYCPEQLHKK